MLLSGDLIILKGPPVFRHHQGSERGLLCKRKIPLLGGMGVNTSRYDKLKGFWPDVKDGKIESYLPLIGEMGIPPVLCR